MRKAKEPSSWLHTNNMFGKWAELFIGNNQAYLDIKSVLIENHINYKTKVSGTRERMSNNVIWGAAPFAVNTIGINPDVSTTYQIFVEKKDIEWARTLIKQR